MPSKKKANSRPSASAAGPSSSSAGASKVSLSAENELRVRRLLADVDVATISGQAAQHQVGDARSRAKYTKQVRTLYEALTALNFASSNIESAIRALPLDNLTTEVALDWLCLNVPAEELPIQFSMGVRTAPSTAGSLRVLATAKADAAARGASANRASVADDQTDLQTVRKLPSKADVKEKSEQGKKEQAQWIKQYLAQQAEEESTSGDEAASSDSAASDWEMWADPSEQSRRKQLRQMDPAARMNLFSKELSAAKQQAALAKTKGDKNKQAEAGCIIRELKVEMDRLGITEDMLLPVQDQSRPKAVDAEPGFITEAEELQSQETAEPAMEGETHRAVHDEPLPEEEGMGGMFDEESSAALPESVLRAQQASNGSEEELLRVWGDYVETSSKKGGKKGGQDGKQQQANIPQNRPKALLQQLCQKNGCPAPKFMKLDASDRSRFRYAVEVSKAAGTAAGEKRRNKRVGEIARMVPPAGCDEWETIEEAQNVAASWALHEVCSNQPLHRLLPTPYRELWLAWDEAVRAGAGRQEQERETEMDAFVQRIMQEKAEAGPSGMEGNRKSSSTAPSATPTEEGVASQTSSKRAYGDDVQDRRESERLRRGLTQRQQQRDYQVLAKERNALPITGIHSGLLEALEHGDVAVVSGETGSGKTTQVPQYILDYMIMQSEGAKCNIVCTQPRRIAAVSVAERVATERCEPAPGQSGGLVGYHVRLDAAATPSTRLLFCTTGVLLRRLASNPDLIDVSHVIVDEVHERTLQSDFLLIILREIVRRRRDSCNSGGDLPPLKLVLMSATLDAELFAGYFQDYLHQTCPVLSAPGRTFPVDAHYLEDIYEKTGYRLATDSQAALRPTQRQGAKDYKNIVDVNRGRREAVASGFGDEATMGDEAVNPNYDYADYMSYSETTRRNLARLDEDRIDYELLEELVAHVDEAHPPGAILVFLPGMGEIRDLHERLAATRRFGQGAAAQWLLPLHSSLPPEDQRRIFLTPPQGVRKVVIATNIAETSITIPDVVYVIDSGKVKENRYDPHRGMSSLVEAWISQASSRQRKGRAGRVQPGQSFALYTRKRASQLAAYQLPEIMRVPLVEVCLQAKLLRIGTSVGELLDKAVQPPKHEAVTSALKTLTEVGAIDEQERLTPLGQHLAALPVDVHAGKLLICAACFGCLAPALTIAACLSYKTPFAGGLEQRDAADRARQALVASASADQSNADFARIARGQQSDHLAAVAAFSGWQDAYERGGRRKAADFCRQHYLSSQTLEMLADMRGQFARLLADMQFVIPPKNLRNVRDTAWVDKPAQPWNANAHRPEVIKAVLCAGLYPHVATIVMDAAYSTKRPRWTDGRQDVAIHPSSVLHAVDNFALPFLVFHEKVRTARVYLREVSVVSPYALLLFGGAIAVRHESGEILIDGWLRFKAPAQIAVLFKELRRAINSVLSDKIRRPELDVSAAGSKVVATIVQLLADEHRAD
eukprot:jgi/Chlat1/490/Chrsp103S00981